ncbi:hypothetical protein [Pseudobythopirellula maris]|uniref:hypothetical protein n=1 Tax=Pseudobythopirellula maris TaxID=2527991 RepID=UPI0011B78475|nr:hypothetical protein [Pseudobythopirellula maris]
MRHILTICAFALIGVEWGCHVSAQDDVDRWRQSTWQIALDLNTPNLVPAAVQWTVLDNDPLADFSDSVRTSQSNYHSRLSGASDDTREKLIRLSEMTVNWDLGFRQVTGDKVYLLTSAPGVAHTFSSNSPAGKKWIVSKIVRLKGAPVCWCIPVAVETGKEVRVTLDEKNIFDLAAAFDNAIAQIDAK